MSFRLPAAGFMNVNTVSVYQTRHKHEIKFALKSQIVCAAGESLQNYFQTLSNFLDTFDMKQEPGGKWYLK